MQNIPIPLCASRNTSPPKFGYITDYNFENVYIQFENNLGRSGCKCVDNCSDKLKCSCWQLNVKFEMERQNLNCKDYTRQAHIGYDKMKLQERGIVECGQFCRCCSAKCSNRVVQNGVQHEFEIFNTRNKGWGVRGPSSSS